MRYQILLMVYCSACFIQIHTVEFERMAFKMPMRCDMAVAVDIDKDKDLDIIGLCRTKIIAIQMPERQYHTLLDAKNGGIIHGTTADMDQDGDLDIIICRFNNPFQTMRDKQEDPGDSTEELDFTIAWIENVQSVTTQWPIHVIDNAVNGTHGVAVADLDNDHKPDVIAANVNGRFPGSVSWYPNGGDRLFIQEKKAGGRPHYIATGHLNEDDIIDVVLGTGGGYKVYLSEVDKKQWIPKNIKWHKGGTNVAVADCDGDGDLDIIGSAGHGRGILWFENPSWTEHVVNSELGAIHSLAVGDFNQDGRSDIVYNSYYMKQTGIFLQNKNGLFEHNILDQENNQQSYGCGVIDVDGDGKNDILLGGRQSNNVVWYRQK